MAHRFQDHVAIVTGAAGGLGLETCRQLVAAGCRLIMVDVDAGRLEAARQGLSHPSSALSVAGDASDSMIADAAVEAARTNYGRLDLLFNNAGIDPLSATTFSVTSDDDWDRIIRVNLRSAFVFSKASIPLLAEGDGGTIVCTSSIAGIKPIASEAAYSVSKAAVIALTRGLAQELASRRIRVNCVCPGALEAPLSDRAAAMTEAELEARGRRLSEGTPMGRMATYAEVAALVLFLAGPDASYITGDAVVVDGGRHVA